jgi:GNAT superfamily N-acetyltransferase
VSKHLIVRPVTPDDADGAARIFDLASRCWATSVAQQRRQKEDELMPVNGIRIVAEADGQIVGAASANEALEGLVPQPGVFSAKVAVDPQATSRGVGRALWATLSQWICPQSPQQIISWTDRDDSRSVAIARHWGFERRPGSIEDPDDVEHGEAWAWHFRLDLSSIDPDRVNGLAPFPQGVHISALVEALDDNNLMASLHEVHEECRADVPAWETYESSGLAEFKRAQHQRLADGGVGLVAHRGRQVLAGTLAERAAFVPDLHNDFTMVSRPARGQRLALAVKSRLVTEAAAGGVERITTEVRSDNPRMLAVNAALGFRRVAMRQLVHDGRDLGAAPSAP